MLLTLVLFTWPLMPFGIILCLTCLILSRLYISPLAKVPGPKIAALTGLYEFYYDVVLGGRYTWKIAEMHRQYGPIVRISPVEIHVCDSTFMDKLYSASSMRQVEKWPWAMRMFGSKERAEAVKTNAYRKQMPSGFFSNSSIHKKIAIIQEPTQKLVQRLEAYWSTGVPVNMTWAFAGLLQDITLQLCFGESYNNVDQPDFGREQFGMNMSLLRSCHLQSHLSWFFCAFPTLSHKVFSIFDHRYMPARRLQNQWLVKVAQLKHKFESRNSRKAPDLSLTTLFDALITNPSSPTSEKTIPRLHGEATSVIGAGLLTPTEVHKNLVYYILATPKVLNNLLAEFASLRSSYKSLPPLNVLDKLPYFTAIIHEGLRMSYGVPHRLQRVHPKDSLVYTTPDGLKTYILPPGTPVGMTSSFVCDDPVVFPEPRSFKPARWLSTICPETGEIAPGMDFRKTTMVFGRGTRDCIGRHFAYAELYVILGTLFWHFGHDMHLHNADCARDIDVTHDWFVSGVRDDSPGLLVTIGRCEGK